MNKLKTPELQKRYRRKKQQSDSHYSPEINGKCNEKNLPLRRQSRKLFSQHNLNELDAHKI